MIYLYSVPLVGSLITLCTGDLPVHSVPVVGSLSTVCTGDLPVHSVHYVGSLSTVCTGDLPIWLRPDSHCGGDDNGQGRDGQLEATQYLAARQEGPRKGVKK